MTECFKGAFFSKLPGQRLGKMFHEEQGLALESPRKSILDNLVWLLTSE